MDDQVMIASEGCDATILNMLRFKRQLHSSGFKRGLSIDRESVKMLMGLSSWAVDMIAWMYDPVANLDYRNNPPPSIAVIDDELPF